jgi:hypothetical protein
MAAPYNYEVCMDASVQAAEIQLPIAVDRKLAARWGKHHNLFSRPEGWVGVPDFFLRGHANLKPYALTSSEAMLVLQLMAFKWTEEDPFPSYARLATRMGVSMKQVRRIARSIEEKGYLKRVGRIGNSNKFDLQPLFDALAAAHQEEIERKATTKVN